MELVFEYHGVSASKRLEGLAKDRLAKLGTKYSEVIRADVFFKEENTTSPETGKICNIRLSLPGPRLFAEASHNTYESAIAETVSDLEKQLQKRKEKMTKY